MKLIPTFALAAATIFVASNYAAAAECRRPAKLTIPDGGTATEDAMKATQAKLTPYAKDMNAYLQCLAAEIKSGKDEYDSVSSEWKIQSEKFKNTPAKQ